MKVEVSGNSISIESENEKEDVMMEDVFGTSSFDVNYIPGVGKKFGFIQPVNNKRTKIVFSTIPGGVNCSTNH